MSTAIDKSNYDQLHVFFEAVVEKRQSSQYMNMIQRYEGNEELHSMSPSDMKSKFLMKTDEIEFSPAVQALFGVKKVVHGGMIDAEGDVSKASIDEDLDRRVRFYRE